MICLSHTYFLPQKPCDNPYWYYHPTDKKCVRGSAVGIPFTNMQACCTQTFGEDESCEWHDACLSPISTLDPNLRQSDSISIAGGSTYSGKSGKSCSSSSAERPLNNGKSGKSCSGGGGLSMTYEQVYLFGSKSSKSGSNQYYEEQRPETIEEESKPDDAGRTDEDAEIAPEINEIPAIPAETGGWLEHDFVTTLQNTPVLIKPLDNDNYIPQGEQ